MRRLLIIGIAIIVSGAISAAAAIGACGAMPCCKVPKTAIKSRSATCCSTVSCNDDQPQNLRLSAAAKDPLKALSLLQPMNVALVGQPSTCLVRCDASPPPTSRERLSILSTLLI